MDRGPTASHRHVRFAMSRFLPVLAALPLFLASCSSGPSLHEGMTTSEVSALLGPPKKVERATDGRETWYYDTISKRRVTTPYNNLGGPEESVFDRDLRLDTTGYVGGLEIHTLESAVEKPIRFGPDGRLLESPPWDFIPTQ